MARLVGGHRDAIITQKKKKQCLQNSISKCKAPSSSGHFIRYPVPARCTGQLQWVVSIRVNQGLAFRKETKKIQSIQFTGFLHLFYWPVKNQHTGHCDEDVTGVWKFLLLKKSWCMVSGTDLLNKSCVFILTSRCVSRPTDPWRYMMADRVTCTHRPDQLSSAALEPGADQLSAAPLSSVVTNPMRLPEAMRVVSLLVFSKLLPIQNRRNRL